MDDERGHVVDAAGFQGQPDEGTRGGTGIIAGRDQAADSHVVDEVGQAVRTQEVSVPGGRSRLTDVHGDSGGEPDGPDDDVLVRKRGDVGWSDQAQIEVLVHERVVAGQLAEPPLAPEIQPAVAHVRVVQTVLAEPGGDERRAHAALATVPPRGTQNPSIGGANGLDERSPRL
jgi:hypothetical protein